MVTRTPKNRPLRRFPLRCGLLSIPLTLHLALSSVRAATWQGVNTDWNTAGNWFPFGVPNTNTTPVLFTDTSAGTVNISSSVTVLSLTFSNLLNDPYTLTSTAGDTLTVPTITMAAGVTTTDTINLANITTGSLLYPSVNPLSITNNSTSGGSLVFGSNTVIGTPGSAGVTFGGPGSITFAGSFATSPNNIVNPFTKTGPGSLDFSGNGTNFGSSTVLNGGTLVLDYFSNAASKSNGSLILGGGLFQMNTGAGGPISQTYSATSFNPGQTDIKASGFASGTLSLSAISRNAAATADFTPTSSGPTFSVQTSTGNTNGLLGAGPAYATVNGGSNWAVQSGVVVAGLAGFSTNIFTSGANTDVTASANPATFTTNSLRFNAAPVTLTLTGTNTLQSGGILVTPSFTGGVITGGTLTAPSSGELIVHVYSPNGITILSALSSTAGLTKTGPDLLTLVGNNTGLTGPINVNRGAIDVQLPAAVNSASAINFNDDRAGGNLQELYVDLGNGANGAITPPIRLSAFGSNDYGTYFSTGFSTGSTVALGGVISSAPGLTTPLRFTGTANNSSGFNLINNNTFTGNISLFQGSLGITSDASLGNAANTLSLEVGDNSNGGLVFLNSAVNVARPITLNLNTRVVSNGADSNTISGAISGGGALIKAGTGTLTLTNSANSFSGGVAVSSGTLSLDSTGSLIPNTNVAVSAGAIFNPGTTSGVSLGTLSLFGGTFRASTGSGFLYINQVVTGPSGGTIDLTGATTYAINLVGVAAAITINGTSTWLSPANPAGIFNLNGNVLPITIAPGVTLTNDIALGGPAGFRIAGGGTLFQNSDPTNVLQMAAPITVGSATTFRVTDASTNGGVGNLGTGNFTLDGGAFSYGGASASTSKPISLSINGGTIQIESSTTTLTSIGAITGLGTLAKTGPGTLIFTNGLNSFASLVINVGTVQVADDAFLGAGPVTVSPGATLLFSAPTSTARTFNLNSGTLQVAAGQTLTLNGASVNGGFMRGKFTLTSNASLSGGTTFNSTNITQTGPASLTNFTNGGTLTSNATLTFAGVVNEGTGIINVNSNLSAQDFSSYGVINIATGANLTNSGSNLFLLGGSRTFIGTKNTPGGTLTLSGGTTLEVNGALLVNDGTISGTTNVNYGGTAQGIGAYGPVNVSFGGIFQPGFASASFPGNSATITQLSGNGTIDNTSAGPMTLTLIGNATSNFSGPIQNSNGDTALNITGTTSLTLSTTALSGGGNSANTYSGGTTVAPGDSFIIAATGGLPSAQPITNNGNFTVNANSTAGQLSGLGTTTLGNNTVLTLAQNTGASKQGALVLNTNAQLNLTTNPLIIEAPNLATKTLYMSQLASEIATGRNGGTWNGPGITSSTVQSNPTQLSIAIADNAILNRTSIGGQSLDANSIIVIPDYFGDANLDGTVNGADLSIVLNNFGATSSAWTSGNFDNAPTIDLTDLADVLNNFGLTNPNASTSSPNSQPSVPSSPTPEPASLYIAATSLALLVRRRKH